MKPEQLDLMLVKLENSITIHCDRYSLVGNIDIIFLGSQSILFHYPNISNEVLLQSYEMDLILSFNQDLISNHKKEIAEISNSIDFAYGYGSVLHDEEEFYIDNMTDIDYFSVPSNNWPKNWLSRALIKKTSNVNLRFICLSIHDVAILKLIAGREKDYDYVEALICGGILKKKLLKKVLSEFLGTIEVLKIDTVKRKINQYFRLPQINVFKY